MHALYLMFIEPISLYLMFTETISQCDARKKFKKLVKHRELDSPGFQQNWTLCLNNC